MEIEKAIIYCRVSTEKQKEDGLSLLAQEQECIKYCKNKGIEIIRIDKETCSAMDMKYQVILLEILDNIESNTNLVIFSLSRFSRNVIHGLKKAKMLHKRNVKIHSISENIDLETASGEFNFISILNMAAFESKQISERVKAAFNVRKNQGYQFGAIPYGKKECKVLIDDLDNNKIEIRQFEDNIEEINIINFAKLSRTKGTNVSELNNALLKIDQEVKEHPLYLTTKSQILSEPLNWQNIADILNDYHITKRGKKWTIYNTQSLKDHFIDND